MGLARTWIGQLFRASGAALLMPGTLIAALAVLAIGGGFGGLSALGQALSGPGIPAATPIAGVPAASGGSSPLLPVVPGGAGAGTTLVASTGGPVAGGGTGAGGGRTPAGGGETGSGGQRGSGGQPGGGTTSPAPPSAGRPTPSPGPPPTVIDRVAGAGTGITNRVPGPVGQLGTSVLQSVANTLDGLLPPVPGSGSAPASKPSPPPLPSSLGSGLHLP
jgi:hypothetical protein